MTELKEAYITSDLDLASTLVALRFPLLDLQSTQFPAQFAFEDTEEMREKIALYDELKLLLQPQIFSSAKKRLRSRMTDSSTNPKR